MTRKELIEQEAERMFEKPDSSADNSTKLEALSARGIFIAGAQFADSLDRWVKVEEGLPPVYENNKLTSIEVIAWDIEANTPRKMFYSFAMNAWIYHGSYVRKVSHYQIINPPIK